MIDVRNTGMLQISAEQGMQDALKYGRGKIDYLGVIGDGFFLWFQR